MLTAGTILIALWIVIIYIAVIAVGFITKAITLGDIEKMLPSFIVTTATTTVLICLALGQIPSLFFR